mgnify:CR=1 FL=1|jgi:hypothetical protein|tara:strand:+ start:339 stop:746 length:408 start_codon:yes stop_codon:yes gene_type:complete
MQETNCCCKHSNKKETTDCKSEATLGVAVMTSLLPHFFCCFMPLLFTAFIGGALAVFFHDYWYVVTSIVALSATIIIYMLRNEKLSVIRVGGNVVIALGVAFVFNVMFHPSHGQADGSQHVAAFNVAQHSGHSHD